MTAHMMTLKLPYLVADVDRHGNVRIYYRRHGRKVRIREQLGSEEFHRRYAELKAGRQDSETPGFDRTPKPNTFRWLCVQFFGSPDFKRLDERTQYVRRRAIEAMFDEPIAPGAKDTFAAFPLAA